MKKHTLMITSLNRSDVLARISALLSARNVRIESIIGAAARNPNLYRIRLVVSVEADRLEQIIKQIAKLIDTVKVADITRDAESAAQRFLLVRMDAGDKGRARARLLQDFESITMDLARPDLCVDLTKRKAPQERCFEHHPMP
jgi:acetolactate synthase-1/3 small subunit